MICVAGIFLERKSLPTSLIWTMAIGVSLVTVLSFWKENAFTDYVAPISSLFILSYVSVHKYLKKYKWEKVVVYLCFLGLIVQFVVFTEERRFVSSIGDPNFAGYIALTLFIFSFYRGIKVGVIFGLVSVFILLSRTYMFSILIFILAYQFRSPLYSLIKSIKLNSFISLFLVTNIVLLMLSLLVVSRFEFGDIDRRQAGQNRLLRLTDGSLYIRLYQNARVFDMLWQGNEAAWVGLGGDVEDKYVVQGSRLKGQPPHNSLFHSVIVYGFIFTLYYLYSVSYIFGGWLNARNVPILIAYSSYAANLHALLLNWWILALALLFLVSNDEPRVKR